MQQDIKVAVLGSCITRDNFNSKFNPTYRKMYECILTQNQSSIISLMSTPTKYDKSKMGELSNYDEWCIRTDLTNEFLEQMKNLKPEMVIIDFFGDAFFGVIQLNSKSYITNNRWKVAKTPYYKEIVKSTNGMTISKNHEAYWKLWKMSIDKLFQFFKDELPMTKVILHKSRFIDVYYPNGETELKQLSTSGRVGKIDVPLLNSYWEKMDRYVEENFNVDIIDLNDEEYYSYEGHPWGPFYIHFNDEYYHRFLDELNNIVIKDYLRLRNEAGTRKGISSYVKKLIRIK